MLRVYMGEGKVERVEKWNEWKSGTSGKVERVEKWNEWNDGTSETGLLISVIPDIASIRMWTRHQ